MPYLHAAAQHADGAEGQRLVVFIFCGVLLYVLSYKEVTRFTSQCRCNNYHWMQVVTT